MDLFEILLSLEGSSIHIVRHSDCEYPSGSQEIVNVPGPLIHLPLDANRSIAISVPFVI